MQHLTPASDAQKTLEKRKSVLNTVRKESLHSKSKDKI